MRQEILSSRSAAGGDGSAAVRTGVLMVLVGAACLYGLLVADAYRDVPGLVRQTWRAQDAVTLVALGLLVVADVRARQGSLAAHIVRTGLLAWVAYCYAHLAVAVPFNPMFLLYVTALALSAFGLLDGLLRADVSATAAAFTRTPRRAAGWFLTIAGVGIAGLWLSDIALGLTGGTPANLHLAGLPNPTWVLDLAWIIPWAFGAALMLRRGHPAGPLVTGVLLVMLTVLSAAMLATTPFAAAAGLADDPVVRPQLVAFTVVFAILGAVEGWLLARGRRRMGTVPPGWARPSWWPDAGPGRPPTGR